MAHEIETQPDLPPEGQFSEIEQLFIEESPPGLWPENQDSNFGTVRRIVTEPMQEASDEMTALHAEQFVDTSVEDLNLHEFEAGLPTGNVNKTLEQRRADLKTRKKKGAFTWARRDEIIQAFIEATFGSSLQFSVDGIPLDAGGAVLLSDASGDYRDLFRIYEDVRNFSYEVWLRDDVDPDLVGLERELARITPAGISFSIVEKPAAQLLSYPRAVRNKQPVAYFRLNGADATDESGYANNGSFPGGNPAAIASPGLLHANVDEDYAGNADGAADFDGAATYMLVPDAAQMDVGDFFSLETWIRPDVLPADGQTEIILDKGAGSFALMIYTGGGQTHFVLHKSGTGQVMGISGIVAGTVYHLVVTKKNSEVKFFLNGVHVPAPLNLDVEFTNNSSGLYVSRNSSGGGFFNGAQDEIAIYNYPLSSDEVLDNYNTGKFIP